jgi:hypothetical protein
MQFSSKKTYNIINKALIIKLAENCLKENLLFSLCLLNENCRNTLAQLRCVINAVNHVHKS